MTKSDRPSRPKTDAPTVVLHWLLVITLALSLITGLRIAADAQDANWTQALGGVLLQGDVIRWHLWAGQALLSFSVAYLLFLLWARLTRRVAVDGARLKSLASPDRQSRWSAINALIYWLAFACILVAGVTGLLLYLAPDLLPYELVGTLHRIAAWAIIAYALVHVAGQVLMGGVRQVLKILNPESAYGIAAMIGFLAAGGTAAAFYTMERSAVDALRVVSVGEAPTLDGLPNDRVWQHAEPVDIHTVRGANQPGGEVTVRVRALHDGEYFYSLFEWPDATRSQKHLPLIKTERGWEVVQKEFGIQDEDDYYEDKFGVMLAYSGDLAGAGTSHLGTRPIDGKPGPAGGRGLHYTTDGSIVDVWHWKSVRSGSAMMNQIDDNYFGPPLEPNPKKKRYTGGYTQDPKAGGGFKMNWDAFDDGTVRPLRLPADPAYLERFADVDLSPQASDSVTLFMPLEATVPYAEALDRYPIGTIMPSVLVEGPFQGDRGDVDAVALWRDGWWRMEVRRKLATGSDFDVSLASGRPVFMWVAVFDHAQTRHTQHLHPVELILE